MKIPRRPLLSRTLQHLRRQWQRKHSPDRQDRRLRLEYLEPRLALTHSPTDHIHATLQIVIEGDQVVIPKNLGLTSTQHFNPHTHDYTGTLHIGEGGPAGLSSEIRLLTLDDFFDVWRTTNVGQPTNNPDAVFDSTHILNKTADATHAVRLYVNGQLNNQFENYIPEDGDKIVISYESINNTAFPSFEPIPDQALLGGAPLWLGIDGLDPNGGPITYSVSVANPGAQPNLVTAAVPTGNRKLVMNVEGFGQMTFELADDLAPDVVNQIVALVNSGFYNRSVVNQTVQSSPAPTTTAFSGSSSLSSANDFYNGQEVLFTTGALAGQRLRILDYVGATRQFVFGTGFSAAPATGDSFQVIREITFHRVVPNFVIQAGDPTATGAGGSSQPDFDDQFNLDLQFTSPGLLAMAKSGDDTNDSQWFITDNSPRFLDFNHSIFGRLIDGEEVRDAINSVATTSDKPNVPVVINSVQLVTDTEDASLRLKAAEGASGQADVTLTATDAQGHAFARTFHVTVSADTANSAPFLINPTNVRGVSGQNIQLQLQALDAENNPSFFDAAKPSGETVNYTLNVDNNTGLVTITPPAGFIGKFNVVVGVRGATTATTNDQFDTQEVEVTVAPAAPTAIDLLAASDTGDSNSDNITNASTLQFTISGVTNGALVKLMKGTSVLAQGTATGTTINLSTTNLGTLGDGVHGLTATQTVSSTESTASPVLNVTLDTTPPANFTSTPPTEADVNVLLTYNAQNPGEGTAGFKYQLVTPPAGASIDASTGVLTWTPASAQLGVQTFGISAVDAAGNVRTQTLNVTVNEAVPPKAEFILRLTKPDGSALTSLATGQDFVLHVFGADLRAQPHGIFAGYLDVQWDAAKATTTGSIEFVTPYGGQQSGSTSTPGLLDEVGAFAGTTEVGVGQKEIFRVPMRATAGGSLLFSADTADIFPAHETLLYGDAAALPLEEIRYGTAAITINATFNAVNDTFNFNEDSQNNTVTPLTNDTNIGNANNVLTISAVGTTNHGGTVTIAADGKSLKYTPVGNFFGTETFTYTAKNQNNETATATVTIQVQPVNDAPSAASDSLNVEKNSTNNLLDVLSNDGFAPDTGETLRISAVGAGSQGGTITIGNNGANLRYTPKANFSGTETFNYTISDRATGGLTAQATVTMNVTASLPTAVNDTATAAEDATTPIEINVLANDLLGEGTALTITAVGAGSQGGTIAITQNGTRINYTPAANKQGTETFTYTINNGIGAATGTVTVNITNSNDAPTAVADTVTAFKNNTVTLDLLANDTSAPDPAENLVIDTVTQPANGTVAITENGKKVSFTPATGFTGSTSFTYSIKDPGGLTAGPVTVTVNVQEFAPSSLAGGVYFDSDNDGVRDGLEQGIGNVTITLTGTDVNNAAVNLTLKTDDAGNYKFNNLLPGNYTLTETHPAFTIDGKETAGSAGGTTSTNEKIVIANLAQNTTATGYNFGERGRQTMIVDSAGVQTPLVRIQDFFTSNSRNYALAAFNSTGQELWHTTHGPGWDGYTNPELSLVNSNAELRIEATTPQSVAVFSNIATTDPRVQQVATLTTDSFYRVVGGPLELNFQPAPAGQGGEGEGEATAMGLASMLAAAALPSSPTASAADDHAVADYLYSLLADGDDHSHTHSNAGDWTDAVDAALADMGD
jgi:cyclophilin family peptidyl-prolyl cis-trans isomerase